MTQGSEEISTEVIMIIASALWPALTKVIALFFFFFFFQPDARAPNFPFIKSSAPSCLPLPEAYFPSIVCAFLCQFPSVSPSHYCSSMHHRNADAIACIHTCPHLDSLGSSFFTYISIPCYLLPFFSLCSLLKINNSDIEDL